MKEDLIYDKGILKWKVGHVYEGDFLQDKRNGKGIFKLVDGNIYEAEILDNVYNGKRTFLIKMDQNMKENGKIIKSMEKEYLN